jgi:hypothetical protein
LALTQKEKFASLAEGIEFDGDLEKLTNKLEVIKESYFNKKITQNKHSSLIEESYDGSDEISTRNENSTIHRYAEALRRTSVKN